MTANEHHPRAAVAEEQFRLLIESVRDYAIFMLDPDGTVASWNAGARLIKGYAPEEIIGQHISIFYTPEARAARRPQQLLSQAERDGRVEEEGWRVRRDGSRFWADVVITALRDPAGRLVGFAKVTRDLTVRREAEQHLRDTEERLSTTLHSIGDGVLATDPQGCITMINRVAQQLTGWTEQEALGRDVKQVFQIVNEETGARAPDPIADALARGSIRTLAQQTVLVARDGAARPIGESAAPIRSEDGRALGAVLVFRDMTEERRAEEQLRQSEARLRLMIASIRDYAIFMLDPQGKVVTWNSGAQRINGYQASEILGRHFSLFFTPADLEAGKPATELRTAGKEGRFEDEAWRVRKDGSRFWANVVISAVRDASGELVGFTKVTRDLTERRKAEDERLRFAQAREALRMRDEFLSLASHELKTPLAALQLHLQGLLDRGHALDDKFVQKLQKIVRASQRLGALVESLLTVTSIAEGELSLQYETFDLVQAARDVLERLRQAARDAHCSVSLRADAPVMGCWDRSRMDQIFSQLLANAFKYAPGAPVTITLRREGSDAVIEVEDEGPGIPEPDLARLFGRFERARVGNYGGLGLGLYLAREIAEAHGGKITAANRPVAGACFSVRIPVDAKRQQALS